MATLLGAALRGAAKFGPGILKSLKYVPAAATGAATGASRFLGKFKTPEGIPKQPFGTMFTPAGPNSYTTQPLLGAAKNLATGISRSPVGRIAGAAGLAAMAGDLATPAVTKLGQMSGGAPHGDYTPEQQDLYSAFRESINSNISGFGGPIKGMGDVKNLVQQIVRDAKPSLKGADYTKNWNVLTNAMSDFLVQSGGALGLGDIDKASAKTILRNIFITRLGGTEKLPQQGLHELGSFRATPSVPPTNPAWFNY